MAFTHEEVLGEVRAILDKHTRSDAKLTEDTALVADLGIDSLGVMEAIADIEDRFEITLEEDHLQEAVTLGDVVKALETLLEAEGKM